MYSRSAIFLALILILTLFIFIYILDNTLIYTRVAVLRFTVHTHHHYYFVRMRANETRNLSIESHRSSQPKANKGRKTHAISIQQQQYMYV